MVEKIMRDTQVQRKRDAKLAETKWDILKRAIWKNSGCCYGTAVFDNEADAQAFGQMVRDEGRTANGGMFDGMALGIVEYGDKPGQWRVTY